jgi:hypothetical protein
MTATRFAATAVMVALLFAAAPASAQVALLDSANTKEFFARHYDGCFPPTFYLPDGEEYQRYFRGWEYVLNEMGVSFTIIKDENVTLEGLSRFQLLILSNTASLSAAQTTAIHQWVTRGGRLLATFGSSYKDVVLDRREADRLKEQKGGTFGLHQLWYDPMTKAFGTTLFGGVVDVRISRYEGPTACLRGRLLSDLLPYGALGNVLVQRPEQSKAVLGWLELKDPTPGAPARLPGIISTRHAHGQVVYFAFAPEYLVSKEFDLPTAFPCPDGQNWAGRSELARLLMRCAVRHLLAP